MAKKKSKIEIKEIVPSVELKALLREARRATSVPDYVAPIPFPNDILKTDLSLMVILDTKPSCRKALIKEEITKKIAEIETYIDSQIQSIPDRLASELLNAIFKLMDELIDQIIRPYDSMINGALKEYNKMVRLFRKLCDPNQSEQIKQEIKAYFLSKLREFATQIPMVADLIAIIMLIENLKTTTKTLRDVKKASPDDFSVTVEKIKYTTELLDQEFLLGSQIVATILYIFKLILPILLALSSIYGTSKEFDKKLNETLENSLNEQNKHNEGQLYAEANKTEIESLATENMNGFSYVREQKIDQQKEEQKEEQKEQDSENLCHSEIDFTNLCPPSSSTQDKTTKIVGAFIELNPKSQYQLNLSKDTEISIGDHIGKINEEIIESPVKGTVYSTDKNVSVVLFDDESTEVIVNSISNRSNSIKQDISNGTIQNEFKEITDKFKIISDTKTIIREFMLYCKLPFIPVDITSNTKIKIDLDFLYKLISKKQDELITKFQDDIKEITGKNHIESAVNGKGLDYLKDEIFDINKSFYDDIIDNFNTLLESVNYSCNTEELTSFKLLPYYLEIYNRIDLDDDNSYLSELSALLRKYIAERKSLESYSKYDFLNTLNTMCENTLKNKWVYKETYKEKFDSIFDIDGNDVNGNSIYKFLENLMECQEIESAPTNFSSIEDINSASASYNRDVSKDELRKKLKEITRQYLLYRDVENFSETTGSNRTDTKNRLEIQTKAERDELKTFFDKVISDYYGNLNVFDLGTFKKFKRASVTKKQNLFYNGVEYEHYYINYSGENDDISLLDEYNKEQLDLASSSLTSVKQFSMKYWLLYCAQATLVHCTLPFYWSCGLVASGVPIPLPVIYIPIIYVGGNVGCLIGLGICGMFIWPMILTVNFNVDARTILMPINIIIDGIKSSCSKLIQQSNYTIQDMSKDKANNFSNEKDAYSEQIRKIDADILNLKQRLRDIGKVRKMRKKKKEV